MPHVRIRVQLVDVRYADSGCHEAKTRLIACAALFFAELKFTDSRIGLFMSLTLVGDVFFGFILTMIADRVGRRKILFGGSFLMVLSGTVFAVFQNFWILLFAAVVGVISTTGSDFGPFRAIEESMLSQLTGPTTRSDVLSWYITLSTLGSALGSEVGGRVIEYIRSLPGYSLLDSYHLLFLVYTIMGLANAGLVFAMTEECEAAETADKYAQLATQEDDNENIELEPPRVPGQSAPVAGTKSPTWLRQAGSLFTDISAETRSICYQLWALLALDSLSDGMVPYSLTNYYVDIKFQPSKATLGDVQSIAYLLSTVGTIFAGPLAKRIGLINTMVFTHVPSSAAVLLFPTANAFWIAVLLLFVRSGLNNMDQAPRASFIAGVVKPQERTAVMGITTLVRTLAATTGPTVTGFLAGSNRFWIAFVVGGSCRLTYDLGLWMLFVNTKLHKHETVDDNAYDDRQDRNVRDEEEEDPLHPK